MVLYVNDISASGTHWRGVFLAETGGDNGSRLTLAENAIVIAAPKQGKLELHLQGGSTHDFDRNDPDHYSVTSFGQSDIPIELTGLLPTQAREIKNDERSIVDLARESGPNWREARVELHRRLAFPAACFAFALIAVPIGAQPRRGGRAAGSLIAVLLIAAYYLVLIMGTGMARQGQSAAGGRIVDGEFTAGGCGLAAAATHGAVSQRVPMAEAGRQYSFVVATAAASARARKGRSGPRRQRLADERR